MSESVCFLEDKLRLFLKLLLNLSEMTLKRLAFRILQYHFTAKSQAKVDI